MDPDMNLVAYVLQQHRFHPERHPDAAEAMRRHVNPPREGSHQDVWSDRT